MEQGRPENPAGWLFQVARNEVRMALRSGNYRQKLVEGHADDFLGTDEVTPVATFSSEIRDDLLRMMLVVCDPRIPEPSQVAIALKVLCGFSVREISLHLFASEQSVYKRLQRARQMLAELGHEVTELAAQAVTNRMEAVHQVLYAIFTQGHLSTSPEGNLNAALCDEAIWLTNDLAEHPLGGCPSTYALLALMNLNRARLPARHGPTDRFILLEEQDRSLWDHAQIQTGLQWLARSATGIDFSRYHAEAGIAAEHCFASRFHETRWDRVVAHYETLERISGSPVHRLNRAVATAELHGPEAGLAILGDTVPPTWLEGSYLWVSVASDLHRRCGHAELATSLREKALCLAPNRAIREALKKRLVTSDGT